jgi:hypothetical protein
MAGEVDRVLSCMSRVERLEDDLERTDPSCYGLVRARLVSARRSQHVALTALIEAAHRGDPEALVALEALESEIEEMTWVAPRPAA